MTLIYHPYLIFLSEEKINLNIYTQKVIIKNIFLILYLTYKLLALTTLNP